MFRLGHPKDRHDLEHLSSKLLKASGFLQKIIKKGISGLTPPINNHRPTPKMFLLKLDNMRSKDINQVLLVLVKGVYDSFVLIVELEDGDRRGKVLYDEWLVGRASF